MKRALYLFLAMTLSGLVSAAELTPGKNTELLFVNGEETKYDSDSVTVQPGYTQVVVRVFMKLGRGSESTSFESDPFMLMFEAGEQDIEIVSPKFKKLDKAERHFKGQPDMKLMSGGKELNYQYVKLQGKSGFLPFRDLDQIVAKYNQENDIPFGTKTEMQAVVELCDGVPNLEQLKEWYQKVPQADREAFKSWVNGKN